jgi:hypothetical protein
MSATFYTSMAATASRLLKKFGMTITIKRTTGGSISPVTGAVVAGSTASYTPQGLVQRYRDDQVDGTRILSSDRLVIVDNTVEPLTTDKITLSSQDWSIIDVKESKPSTIGIVYFIQARR